MMERKIGTITEVIAEESKEITIKVKFKSPNGVTEADLYRELLLMEVTYNSRPTAFRLHITKVFVKK
jgi:hypothetical protein